jgi:hypothetical protein
MTTPAAWHSSGNHRSRDSDEDGEDRQTEERIVEEQEEGDEEEEEGEEENRTKKVEFEWPKPHTGKISMSH